MGGEVIIYVIKHRQNSSDEFINIAFDVYQYISSGLYGIMALSPLIMEYRIQHSILIRNAMNTQLRNSVFDMIQSVLVPTVVMASV